MNDIDILTEDLRKRSLSDKEIVLNYEDSIRAIDLLEAANWLLLGWEPWRKMPAGGHIHSLEGGDFDRRFGEDWQSAVKRTAQECREALKYEQMLWDQKHSLHPVASNQEQIPNALLYFCLTAMDH